MDAFVVAGIGHGDAHQVIGVARHQVALQDVRAIPHRLFEGLESFLALALQRDFGEDAGRPADRGLVDDGDVATDDAARLQLPHPAVTGRGREIDVRRQIGVRHAAAGLQQGEDLTIDYIKGH